MARLLQERISIALIVGSFFFPLYIFQDQRMVPGQWRTFLALRLTCSLLCILIMAVNKSSWGQKRPFWIMLVAAAILSTVTAFITPLKLAGMSVMYYAGHGLIVVTVLSYLPLSFPQAMLTGLCIQLGYSIPTWILAEAFDPFIFLIQNSYLGSTVILLSIGCHLDYRTRHREYDLRSRLYTGRTHIEAYGRHIE
jgi:hypothetical protein